MSQQVPPPRGVAANLRQAPPNGRLSWSCPVCESPFSSRKELLGHLRATNDEPHETLRRQGLSSPYHPALLAAGVLCCPRACGAFFDGGASNTSKPLGLHVAANKCRNRQGRHNRSRELNGPYLPTTMGGINAAHLDIAALAAVHPIPGLPHAPAVTYCHTTPGFATEHLRLSGTLSAASLPGPCRELITAECVKLFRLAVSTRGDALRTAAWDAVHLFPTLVMGPHRAGAPSSAVKAEVLSRLDLWHRGDLPELARRAVAARLARPANSRSKKARAARRATVLLRLNQFT